MGSPQLILVAVKNPAPRVPAALRKAAQLAVALGAQLRLFHAMSDSVYLDPFDAGSQEQGLQKLRERTEVRLEKMATTLRAGGAHVSIATEWDFPVHEAVIRHAQRCKADLIVAGGQAFKHTAPWLLRFTDWELLRASPIPVLLIKSRRLWQRPRLLAAVDPGHAYGKTGALDAAILELTEALQQALRGSLHAVHAFAPLPDFLPAAVRTHLEREAKASLRQLLKGHPIPPRRQHLLAEKPVDAIQDVVRAERIDLVTLGTVSRSGLKRILLGNTAEQLLDALTCDVLVVKPEDFVSPVPRTTRGMRVLTPLPPGGI